MAKENKGEKRENEIKKEYLRGFQRLNREIEQKQYSLSRLMDSRDRITTIITDMPKGNSNKDKSLIADEIIDLQNDLQYKLKKAIILRTEIKNKIEELSEIDEIIVLSYRYIDNMMFEEIAQRMSFSIRTVYYLHGKALENIVL